MAHDVFISHSAHDKPIADAVCAALEKAGIRCWVAPRDVQPGRSFAGEITRAIQNSKVMVLIFSAHSNTSEQILREVELAVNSRLHIVQFRIEEVLLNDDLKYYLSTPHWLDALSPPLEDHLERLVSSIKTLLGKTTEELAAQPAPLPEKIGDKSGPAMAPKQTLASDPNLRWVWIAGAVAVLLLAAAMILWPRLRKPAAAAQNETTTPSRNENVAPILGDGPTLLKIGTGYRVENNRLLADRYGFIDTSGHVQIEPKWENEHAFFEGLACVKRDGKWGLINKSGRIVIEPKWEEAPGSSEGFIPVERDGKWGCLDETGRVVIEPQWDRFLRFEHGVAPVERGGKWGLIDKTGRIVAEPQWDVMNVFSEGLAAVKRDGKFGFINDTGRVVIAPQWEAVGVFGDGFSAVKDGGKFGFIDKNGRVAIPPQFDNALSFSEGLAPVLQNRRWGFIDSTGRMVIPPQFESVQHFVGDMAGVRRGGKWGCIDKTGRMIVEPQWDSWLSSKEGIVEVKRDGKLGFLDKDLRVVIEPSWDVMEYYRETRRDTGTETLWLLLARKEGDKVTASWFDASGKKIWSSP